MGIDRRPAENDKPENKGRPGNDAAAAHQSLLDYAVHTALHPVLSRISSNQKFESTVDDSAKNFLKIAPLFVEGKFKAVGTLAAYVADEVKRTDHGQTAAVDAALGAAKATSLLETQRLLGKRNTTPSLMGVEMGIVNRASDTAFTGDNYYDAKGNFSLSQGLERTTSAAFASVPTDLTTFAASDALYGRLYIKSRGAVGFNPVITSALTASTFNVTTAAGSEISHQIHDGQLDVGALVAKTASAAAIGLAAGSLGGLQRRSSLNTGITDGANALNEARSTPFQTGETMDAAQAALKNGRFVADHSIKSYMNLAYAGRVIHEDGTQIPAIFRAPNGRSDFAHRQQSEIGAYGLSTRMNLPSEQFPTTVAGEAHIDGTKMQGFIQEMKGTGLKEHFASEQPTPAAAPTKAEILKQLANDPALTRQLQSAWSERLIFGEWDNHTLNQMVHKQPDPKAFNIDIGDAFRPATTSLDHVPHPGLRKSYDNLNGAIYRKLAASKFEPELTANLNQFVRKYDTVEGRNEIQRLGFTPQQVDGIMGRARWLAENERLPRGNQTTTYQHTIKTAIRGYKFVKNRLGPPTPAPSPEAP